MKIFGLNSKSAYLPFGKEKISGDEFLRWIDIINNVIGRIDFLTGSSEKEFLTIGGSLQQYYQSAKEIAKTSSLISGLIAEKVIKSGITELNDLLKNINQYLDGAARDIENGEKSLQKILSVLSNVSGNLSGFKRIVKHLRMLGISTRIESARFSQDNGGFNTLADNVEKLSLSINDKSTLISEKIGSLINQISKATSVLLVLENKQREQTSQVLRDINQNLSELNSKYDLCSKKSEIVAGKSENVSAHIGQIVSSIQFHDITRQQMEHVSQTLESLREKMLQETGQTNDSKQIDEPGQMDESWQTTLTVYIHDICNLQSMQLKHSKDELCSAVVSIIGSLNEVRLSTSDILIETEQMFDNKLRGSGSSIITDLKEGFSSISEDLAKNSGIHGELTTSIRTITGTVQELSHFVNEIEEIGSEIELIALNASIKAAHTGSEGAALGVLAESIQRLSHDAKVQTTMVSETLKTISDNAGELNAQIDSGSEEMKSGELKHLTELLSSKIETLSELDNSSMQALSSVRGNAVKLDSDICSLTGSINVHNQTACDVVAITDNLDEITGLISSTTDHSLLNREDKLRELQQQYTMNSERNIHNSLLRGVGRRDLKQTEEFPAAYDELGSNVELF